MDPLPAKRGPAISWAFALALVLASLLNGAVPYLSRIGVLEPAAYERYVSTYCRIPEPVRFPVVTCPCMQDPGLPESQELPSNDYVFRSDGMRLLPKLGKDLLMVVVVLAGAAAWIRRRRSPSRPWPTMAFTLAIVFGFLHSAFGDGLPAALSGLRPFGFLAVALLAGWAMASLPVVARWLVGLLLLECVLVAFEFAYGMPTRACPRFYRAAGSMVLSSSLGITAACCAAFVMAIGVRGAWLAVAFLAATALVLAAGSGTGIVLMLVLAAWLAWSESPGKRTRTRAGAAFGIAGLLLVLSFLPALTHRPDVWDSVGAEGGRLDTLVDVWRANSFAENLFGRGLALGSNQATNLAAIGVETVRTPLDSREPFHADSSVTMLLVQVGLAGVLAFYAMLAWACRVDPAMRSFYLVAGIASLTINLPEAFPANLLLGLALARSTLLARANSPAMTAPRA